MTDYSVLVGVHDTESSDAGVHTKGVRLLRKTALTKLLPMIRLVGLGRIKQSEAIGFNEILS